MMLNFPLAVLLIIHLRITVDKKPIQSLFGIQLARLEIAMTTHTQLNGICCRPSSHNLASTSA